MDYLHRIQSAVSVPFKTLTGLPHFLHFISVLLPLRGS